MSIPTFFILFHPCGCEENIQQPKWTKAATNIKRWNIKPKFMWFCVILRVELPLFSEVFRALKHTLEHFQIFKFFSCRSNSTITYVCLSVSPSPKPLTASILQLLSFSACFSHDSNLTFSVLSVCLSVCPSVLKTHNLLYSIVIKSNLVSGTSPHFFLIH